jgi:choline kinase
VVDAALKKDFLTSMTIDKAVILAAGMGNRISKIGTTPKPLLPLDGAAGETFLDWHIDRLASCGVREIFLVGNKRTFETPLRTPANTTVTWILNPTEDLSRSGSGHSTWYAWKSAHNILDGRSRVMLMDADILYEPTVLSTIDGSGARSRSCSLVCSEYRQSNEEVMVFGNGNNALMHGKGLLGTALTTGLTCLGEATGMVLFEAVDHALVAEATDWCMRYSTAKERSEHEDITQRMMMAQRIEAVSFRDLLFMECDTPDEYEHLTTEFYPRVLGRTKPSQPTV